MRFLVAVISCEQEPYWTIENEGARKTWAARIPYEMGVLFYYGRPGKSEIVGDRVYLDCPESWYHMTQKALLFFEKILEEYKDLEYAFFTNLSSYIRLEKILESFRRFQGSVYSGLVGEIWGIHYASGAGFFLSRDLIKMVVDNRDQFPNFPGAGDVALGKFFADRGIPAVPRNYRLDLCKSRLSTLTRSDVINHYHFRCKPAERTAEAAYDDIVVMQRVHALLQGG